LSKQPKSVANHDRDYESIACLILHSFNIEININNPNKIIRCLTSGTYNACAAQKIRVSSLRPTTTTTSIQNHASPTINSLFNARPYSLPAPPKKVTKKLKTPVAVPIKPYTEGAILLDSISKRIKTRSFFKTPASQCTPTNIQIQYLHEID